MIIHATFLASTNAETWENSMWKILLAVAAAGALGGLANALLSGTGFVLPHFELVAGSHVLAPGFVGSAFIGGIAAFISYGLYGPFSNLAVVKGGQGQPQDGTSSSAQLTLAALAGAILVGFSGGRWMTTEADKQFNHGTALATAQAAESFIASKENEGGMRALPAGSPRGIGKADMESLTQAIQTRTPLESYQRALNILSNIGGRSTTPEPK